MLVTTLGMHDNLIKSLLHSKRSPKLSIYEEKATSGM